MNPVTRFLEQVKQNASGNAVVEMALYLPIVLAMFAGMVDFSLAVSQKLRAQQAVTRTLEMTSNIGYRELSSQILIAEAAQAAGVAHDRVDANIWLECDGVVQPDVSGQCASSDGLARYASVSIEDKYQLILYDKLFNSTSQSGVVNFSVQGSLRIQ